MHLDLRLVWFWLNLVFSLGNKVVFIVLLLIQTSTWREGLFIFICMLCGLRNIVRYCWMLKKDKWRRIKESTWIFKWPCDSTAVWMRVIFSLFLDGRMKMWLQSDDLIYHSLSFVTDHGVLCCRRTRTTPAIWRAKIGIFSFWVIHGYSR